MNTILAIVLSFSALGCAVFFGLAKLVSAAGL
jgi:hypothetical protein